jgi:tRNA threonylcarbamoyladenosine biosynthesis protein TsaE
MADRLGELSPPDALSLAFSQGELEDERLITATWAAGRWDPALKELTIA